MKSGIVAILACLSLLGCQSGGGGTSEYHSQLGNFTCPMPQLGKSGNKVESSTVDSDEVTFSDDEGKMLRIESFNASRLLSPAPSTEEQWGGALQNIFYRHVMAREILTESLKASVVQEQYVPTAVGKAYFAAVLVPGGADVLAVKAPHEHQKVDAVRGVLLFPQHGFLYVVIEQNGPSGRPATAPGEGQNSEQADTLLRELRQIVARMTFD